MDELQKRGIQRFLWSCPEGSIIHVYRCIESSTYNASPACWTLLIYIQSIVQVMIRLAKIVIATKLSFLWSTQTWECRSTECSEWIAALWQIQSIGVLSTQGDGQLAQPFQCATPLSLVFTLPSLPHQTPIHHGLLCFSWATLHQHIHCGANILAFSIGRVELC